MELAAIVVAGLLLVITGYVCFAVRRRRIEDEQRYQEQLRAVATELEEPVERLKQALLQCANSPDNPKALAGLVELGLRIEQIKREKSASTRSAMIYRCRTRLMLLERHFSTLQKQPLAIEAARG